jgi:hypothetical protein
LGRVLGFKQIFPATQRAAFSRHALVELLSRGAISLWRSLYSP